MNPSTDSLHAGIAGVKLGVDNFDLGHGVNLRKTYAHFMAPFLLAFSPAENGKPHPAPWSSVSGGLGYDIYTELYVPASFNLTKFFDRLNTIWWITALVRLRGAATAHVPVIAEKPLTEIPENWKTAKVLSVEILPRRLIKNSAIIEFSTNDLEWLRQVWVSGGQLMGQSNAFNDAFQALDAAGAMQNHSVALLAMWGALEHLFSPAKQELRFRVSANIASFLEPPGPERLKLSQKIMKLYDARSQIAHGTKVQSLNAMEDTYSLSNRILTKILSEGHVPTKEDLETELFAPNKRPATGI